MKRVWRAPHLTVTGPPSHQVAIIREPERGRWTHPHDPKDGVSSLGRGTDRPLCPQWSNGDVTCHTCAGQGGPGPNCPHLDLMHCPATRDCGLRCQGPRSLGVPKALVFLSECPSPRDRWGRPAQGPWGVPFAFRCFNIYIGAGKRPLTERREVDTGCRLKAEGCRTRAGARAAAQCHGRGDGPGGGVSGCVRAEGSLFSLFGGKRK